MKNVQNAVTNVIAIHRRVVQNANVQNVRTKQLV
jgi:hypothetical protein